MNESAISSIMTGDLGRWLDWLTTPSFKTMQLALVVYLGLLWLSVIVWVTRDAINRSESVLFQALAILLNIVFPVLGILLYLIIRPSKTILERYYEDLEHKLILESVPPRTESSEGVIHTHPLRKKSIRKPSAKNEHSAPSVQPPSLP
jgi:hypothetical protein